MGEHGHSSGSQDISRTQGPRNTIEPWALPAQPLRESRLAGPSHALCSGLWQDPECSAPAQSCAVLQALHQLYYDPNIENKNLLRSG